MSTLLALGLTNVVMATALALCAAVVGRFCKKPALTHSLWLLVLLKLVTPPLLPVALPWSWGEPEPAPVVQPAPITPAVVPVVAQVVTRPTEVAAASPERKFTNVGEFKKNPGKAALERLKEGANEAQALPSSTVDFTPAEVLIPAEPVNFVAAEPTAPMPAPASAPRPVRLADLAPFFGILWLARLRRLVCAGGAAHLDVPSAAAFRPPGSRRRAATGAQTWPPEWGCGAVPASGWSPVRWRRWCGPPAGPPASSSPPPCSTGSTRTAWRLCWPTNWPTSAACDHWVRWVEMLTFGLYWWYPLLVWVRRRLRAAEEECCDAWVVGELPAAATGYARALLETVDFLSVARPALPPVASGIGQVEDIKRRLLMIVRGATPRKLSPAGKLAVLALFLLLPLVPTPAESAGPGAAEDKAEQKVRRRPLRSPRGRPPANPAAPSDEEPIAFQNRGAPLQQEVGEVWQAAISPDGKTIADGPRHLRRQPPR